VSGEMLGWGDTPGGNFPPIGSPGVSDFLVMSTPMKVAPHTPPNAGRGGTHTNLGHAGTMFPQQQHHHQLPQGEAWGGGVIMAGGGVNVSEASSAASAPGGVAAGAAHSSSPTTTATTGGGPSRGSPAGGGNLTGVSGVSGYMAFSPAGELVPPGGVSMGDMGVPVTAPGGGGLEGTKGGSTAGPGSPPAADANSEMLTEGMLQLLTPMKLTS
jgi:hypothetical protein